MTPEQMRLLIHYINHIAQSRFMHNFELQRDHAKKAIELQEQLINSTLIQK